MQNVMKIDFFKTPSQLRAQVSFQELIELDIAPNISGDSYSYDTYVFLEEDYDFPIFVEAARAAGFKIHFREPTFFGWDVFASMERYSPIDVKACYVPRLDAKPSRTEVEACLPRNFFITDCSDEQIVIKGVDNEDCTIERDVIANLASASISALRGIA